MITGIFPPDVGGPATYVPQMAEALAGRGHHVTVVTLSDGLFSDEGYPFRVLRLQRRQPRWLRWFRTLRVLVTSGGDADVFFVHGLALEAVLVNTVLHKALVLKVVGDIAWEQSTNRRWMRDDFERFQAARYGVKITLLKALRTWWTRRADRVIVPSRYLARWTARWGIPPERMATIYNAVGTVSGLPPVPLALRTSFNVVTAARLVPWKGVDLLAEAVARLEDTGLIVIGDGPERPRLVRLTQSLGLADRVHFAGQRERREAMRLMAACDLFVLNSAYEGLPHVLLEAMALGLPVVATAVGGVTEIVRDNHNGRLIPSGDVERLAAVLTALRAAPEERRRLGEAGRRTAAEFSFAAMVDATEAVLRTAVRSVRA